jgi:DNA repair protein RadA/Sms
MKFDRKLFGVLSDVISRAVKFMWEPYLVYGMVNLLEGDPNVGKSYFAMHLTAMVTTGGKLPGAPPLEIGRVLYISPEDDPGYTIRPRIEAMGGDSSLVTYLNDFLVLDDPGFEKIEEELGKQGDYTLIVIDTLFGVVPTAADTNKPNDMRQILNRLSVLAAEHDLVALVIRHWTKGDRGKALYRGGGSIDIIGVARSALAVAKHPDDDELRVIAHVKHNLSERGASQLYEIRVVEDEDRPILIWRGECDLTADELQASVPTDPKAREQAEDFLTKKLAKGPQLSRELFADAKAEGISKRTLERAKKAVGAETKKVKDGWKWYLPES